MKRDPLLERRAAPKWLDVAIVVIAAAAVVAASLLLGLLLVSCATTKGKIAGRRSVVNVVWMESAEKPWPDLDTAIDAALDVADVGDFELQIYGSNDLMEAPSTPDPTCDQATHECATVLASTEMNECVSWNPFNCRTVMRLRQLRSYVTSIDVRTPKLKRWSGRLLRIEEADALGQASAFFDDWACRLASARKGLPWGYTPVCLALRDQIRSRYLQLRAAEH